MNQTPGASVAHHCSATSGAGEGENHDFPGHHFCRPQK